MGKTAIEWADFTFNPWWGCEGVSPACKHCYAETFDHRLGGKHWGGDAPRRFFGDDHWRQPLKWALRARGRGVRYRVFCASMADVFEDRADLEPWRARLWSLIRDTPDLDWLLLTKRPENFARMLPWGPPWDRYGDDGQYCHRWFDPWLNVWLGVTAENQEWAAKRIPILLETPAVVRFVSAEPLLGPLWLRPDWMETGSSGRLALHWLIAGGESGVHARRTDVEWLRSLRDQCHAIGTRFFLKQMGGHPNKRGGDEAVLDGRTHTDVPASPPDSGGSTMAGW